MYAQQYKHMLHHTRRGRFLIIFSYNVIVFVVVYGRCGAPLFAYEYCKFGRLPFFTLIQPNLDFGIFKNRSYFRSARSTYTNSH